MTPKEKAKELYNKFCEFTPVEFEQEYTKKCALIAVDEILKVVHTIMGERYWLNVKQEIEKL
jgi:hypothetical protein